MRKYFNVIVILILLVSSIFNVVLVNRLDKSIDAIVETKLSSYETVDTVFFNSVVFDTVYFNHFDTVKLETIKKDTITKLDSILVFDSVEVFVPINTYKFDTTLNETHINLICEGFDVVVKDLYVESILSIPTQEKVSKKWYENIHLGVGLSGVYMDGLKILPSVGIYYKLF